MKINRIFSALFGGALLFGAAACTDEVKYTPADNVADDGVYLADTESNVIDIETDANSVTIDLFRVNADDVLTVGIEGEVVDAQGNPVPAIFSVPTQVTFQKGETVVPIEIGVVFGDVTPEEEYKLNLKILSDQQNPYGLSEREYIITYAPWSEWALYGTTDATQGEEVNSEATVTFTQWLKGSAIIPLFERKSLVNPNRLQYMVPDPLSLDEVLADPEKDPVTDCDWYYIFTIDKSQTINVDGQTCYRVTTNVVNTGQKNSSGAAYTFSCAYNLVVDVLNYAPADADAVMAQNNMKQSYYNPETGLISVFTVLFARNDGGVGLYGMGYEYILLPGYKDYWMEFAYLGNFVDNGLVEQAIIEATRCTDLASYAYRLEKGELTNAQVNSIAEEIKADTEAELVFEESTNLLFSIEENGTYTLVAVGYDEGGNAEYTTSYTFDYATVKKESEWESRGWADYTDGFFLNAWYSPTLGGQQWEVEVEEHISKPGYYRILNPYQEWPINLQYEGAAMDSGVYYLYINAQDPDGVYVEDSDSGINLGKLTGETTGHSILGSAGYYFMQQGNSFEVVKQNGWFGTLKNGKITFPAGTLTYQETLYDGMCYANIDPSNPYFDNPKAPNPNYFLGQGTFCLDLSGLDAKAPRKAAAKASAPVSVQRIADRGYTGDLKAVKGFRATKKSAKELRATDNNVKILMKKF